jgi:hypothetical protein
MGIPRNSRTAVRRAVAASVAAGISSAAVEAALASSAAAVAGSAAAGHGVVTALAVWGGAGIVTGIAVTAATVTALKPAAPKAVPPPTLAAQPKRSPAAPAAAAPPFVQTPTQEPQTSTEAVPNPAARTRRPGVAEELRLLAEARAALRDGKPGRALVLTREHERRFGDGALAEEALATQILALCALGRHEQGRAGIFTLERIAPNSPQLPRVRSACSDNP